MVKATAIVLITFALLAAVQATTPMESMQCKPKNVCQFENEDDTGCTFKCTDGCGKSAKQNREKLFKHLTDCNVNLRRGSRGLKKNKGKGSSHNEGVRVSVHKERHSNNHDHKSDDMDSRDHDHDFKGDVDVDKVRVTVDKDHTLKVHEELKHKQFQCNCDHYDDEDHRY